MKYQLLKPMNPNYNAVTQILTNRGIPENEVSHYLCTTDADISAPTDLGEDLLKAAAQNIINHIFSKN